MSDFRKGLAVGLILSATLVVWKPDTARQWGWYSQRVALAVPEKVRRVLSKPTIRKKTGGREQALRKKTVLQLRKQLGVPYQYGGDDPHTGFDCSGLVQHVLFKVGRKAPRSVEGLWSYGLPVVVSDLRAGDLLFFQIYSSDNIFGRNMNHLTSYFCWAPNHVGIYIGKGKMIHAPRTGKKVETVRVQSGFWKQHLVAARNPF